jgi:hypothetical protein
MVRADWNECVGGAMSLIINPKINTLTYAHIIDASELKNWNSCVDRAKMLLKEGQLNRMAVADIAIQASIIKRGGSRTSVKYIEQDSMLTISAFAHAIGMNPSTLHLWVSIKTQIFGLLPPEEQNEFRHDAGEKSYKALGKKKSVPPGKTQDTYLRFKNRTRRDKAIATTIKNIACLSKFFLKTHWAESLTKNQLEMSRIAVGKILKRIIELQAKEPRGKNERHQVPN